MILPFIVRKILLFFAPILIFYILRKLGRKALHKKSHHSNIDKSSIVEGEIVERRDTHRSFSGGE